jgi:squalene-hopene/tetraprenyl-beta-curcumene cyclase
MNAERVQAALRTACAALRARQKPGGFWEGHLSSSALSSATAMSALALAGHREDVTRLTGGARWLVGTQNPDGGWGDTPDSPSNLSTTLLVVSALRLCGSDVFSRSCPEGVGATRRTTEVITTGALARAEEYLCAHAGRSAAERRAAVCAAYGEDRTFAAPILMNGALAKVLPWEGIPSLPYEFAVFPHSWYRLLRLHVVSYALPALIAVGVAIHRHQPPRGILLRLLRRACASAALARLARIQPENGGFLEATPLTSFVAMSLISVYGPEQPVARKCLAFLRQSVRADGSWPIDTNLSVWLTTASVTALDEAGKMGTDQTSVPPLRIRGGQGESPAHANGTPPNPLLYKEGETSCLSSSSTREWLLAAQHRKVHPYTGTAPGGWAWTDLPGGVPDVDDTAGAILALVKLGERGEHVRDGVRWLLSLQNSDGGWPTFCRGWGKLPFDRSAPDLTAHAIRALGAFDPEGREARCVRARRAALEYLRRQWRERGPWRPLWFGNPWSADQSNPVLGTARVLRALAECEPHGEPARPALAWLLAAQRADGGWGGAPDARTTVEETALAVSALAGWPGDEAARSSAARGAEYLARCVEDGSWTRPAPLGLYFARLWYSEELYPLIWTVEALGRVFPGNAETASGDSMDVRAVPGLSPDSRQLTSVLVGAIEGSA